MQTSVSKLLVCSVLALAAGCARKGNTAAQGRVVISPVATLNTPGGSGGDRHARQGRRTDDTPVCAQFSFQPYAPAADGSPVLSGSAFQIISSAANANGATTATDSIQGCIDGTPDGAGYNWGYIVTATDFAECGTTAGTLGTPVSVSPTTVTVNVPVHCIAGQDSAAQVSVTVAAAVPNSGGYVDISAGVNATDVEVGCKTADINSSGTLHFGESWMGDTAADAPDGIWGLGLASGTPQQWSGQVSGGQVDQNYTGQLQLSSPSAALLVQTLMPAGCADTFVATAQPTCVTTVNDSSSGAATATTNALLADAFTADAADGWASAIIDPGGAGVTLYSASTLTPIPAGATPVENSPADADAITSQDISDPGIAAITGLWPSLDQFGFVFTFTSQTGDSEWGRLTNSGGLWSISGETLLSDTSTSQQTCVGLFASGAASCQALKACTLELHAEAEEIKLMPRFADKRTIAGDKFSYNATLYGNDGTLQTIPLNPPGNGEVGYWLNMCGSGYPPNPTMGVRLAGVSDSNGNALSVVTPGSPATPVESMLSTGGNCALPPIPELDGRLSAIDSDGMGGFAAVDNDDLSGGQQALTVGAPSCTDNGDGSWSVAATDTLASSSARLQSAPLCTYRFETARNGLGRTDTVTESARNRRVEFKVSGASSAAKYQSWDVAARAAPLSDLEVQYNQESSKLSLTPGDTCATTQASRAVEKLDAFARGLDPSSGNRYAYGVQLNGNSLSVGFSANPQPDCQSGASIINEAQVNTLTFQERSGSQYDDVCVSTSDSSKFYTRIVTASDTGSGGSWSFGRVQVDTATGALDDTAQLSDDEKVEAPNCFAAKGAPVQAVATVPTASQPQGNGAVDSWSCGTSDGETCVCVSAYGIAFGSMGVSWGMTVCRVGYVFSF